MDNTTYKFQGNAKLRPKKTHQDSPQKPEPYIASSELIRAVNLAIFLRRPLLLEGEAGCGKTRLAHAIAYELGLPFYRWDIRSTTKAQDGLYKYDAILRLHDVQTREVESQSKRDPGNAINYRKLGALGKAFSLKECPAVVLIDEIDKADIDFPNDLLTVLDDPWEFEIPETGEPAIKASHTPIVIITSNKEKGNLPTPFLRRCIYYFVKFPSEKLEEIVRIHYESQNISPPSKKLVDVSIKKFLEMRREGGLFKIPGTSEFLDWLKVLFSFENNPYSAQELESQDSIPFREVLIKLRGDWQKYE